MHTDLLPPAWALCLSAFERELTPQQFATWIRPLSCADEGGTLKLVAPNRFVLQWVRDRFSNRIEALAHEATGAPVTIEFAVVDAASAAQNRRETAREDASPGPVRPTGCPCG
jgi:chromosomal replication initiator protein